VRITGWSIDGFGVFHDEERRDLGQGLTVLLGPNEAGKSTLLAFVRGVLFGFPDGRQRTAQRYPPLNGGVHGGRLFLAGPDGEYVLERGVGRKGILRLLLPDGREGDDLRLRTLLGGADQALFSSVFAFSLTELQRFASLTDEGVGERIFSAGISGAGQSARTAVKALEAGAATAWRPRGESRVATLLRELEAAGQALDEARRVALSHPRLVALEDACRERVAEAAAEAERVRQRGARMELLIDLWDVFSGRDAVRRELAALEPGPTFGDDARERLTAALAERTAAIDAAAALRADDVADRRRREELVLDDRLAAVAGDVEALSGELAVQRSREQTLEEDRGRHAAAARDVAERLVALGDGWDEERAGRLDASLPRRERIRGLGRQLDAALAAVEGRRLDAERTAARVEAARLTRDELAAEVGDEPLDRAALAAQAQALQELRSGLAELAALEAHARGAQALAAERAEAARRHAEAEPAPGGAPRALWLLALGVAGFLAATAGLFTAGATSAALATLALAALLALVAGSLCRRQVEGRERRAAHAAEQERLSAAGREAQVDGAAAREAVDVRRASLDEPALALALDGVPEPAVLERRAALLEEAQSARASWDATAARLADAERQLVRARQEHATAEVCVTSALADADRVGAQWAEVTAETGLPEGLDPAGALDVLDAAGALRAALHRRDEAAADVERGERDVAAYRTRVEAALEAAGEEPGDGDPAARLPGLRGRCAEDREARAEAARLDTARSRRAAQLEAAEARVRRAAEGLQELLAEGGAGDEAEFRRHLAVHERRLALESAAAQADGELQRRVGRGEAAEAVLAELATGDVEAWRREAGQSKAALAAAEAEHRTAIRAEQDAIREREGLEASADVPARQAEVEALRAELLAAVREYREHRLAAALVQRTLRAFTQERQPTVLADASRLFARVTRRGYTQLVQEDDGERIAVIDRRGVRKEVGELSRGTAEQLYLCIRLALAREFAERSSALPLVIDDCLVNFDPGRQAAMAQALGDYAEQHQVLVFTCHPATRDLLLDVHPRARVITLGERKRPELVAVQQTLAV
jgi:uncharacterized protein YhaN